MSDISPAVERAVAAAEERANREPTRLGHLVLSLLDDDEGRPATALQAMGLSLEAVREAVQALTPDSARAPHPRRLYNAARDWSVEYRSDPLVLTDAFLIAVLQADTTFDQSLAAHGISAASLQRHIVGNATVEPAPVIPEQPETPQAEPFEATEDRVPVREAGPPEYEEGPRVMAGRIVDANLNRARESLRVLDDFCRFGLDDRVLTERFKYLRHRLAELASALPAGLLLAARATEHDVGTTIAATGEYRRASAHTVAAVNLKRLQESLRSVEEYGKVLDATFAQGIEQVRYEAYTLERAVVRGTASRDRLADARLYVLLSADQCKHGLERTISAAAAGGADVIQLREKELPDRELLERARSVRRWTHDAGVLFIVNDRPDIARLADADGVHLGQDDLAIHDARRLLGPDALIGVSTHTLEQVQQAVLDGADYIGVGPTFPSRTKRFDHFAGLEFVAAATAETSLPAFVLGGINATTIAEAIAAGARRVAVSAAIADADDPETMARILRAAVISAT